MFTMPQNVNWYSFAVFAVLVVSNFVFGIYTMTHNKEKQLLFRIIGLLLVFALIGYFCYVAYTNHKIQDYEGYKLYFEYDLIKKDKGYRLIQNKFKEFGFVFEQYRLFFFVLCYIVFFTVLSIFKVNKNFVFSLYALFPWCWHLMQMRTCLGFMIVLLASTTLLIKGKLKIIGIPVFVGLIYVAYTIHASMLVYGVMIVCFGLSKNNNYLTYLLMLASVICILLFYNGIDIVPSIVPETIYKKYYVEAGYSKHVPNVYEYSMMLLYVILVISSVSVLSIKNDNEVKSNSINCLSTMKSIVVCMLAIIVVITINTDMVRLIRNCVLFLYIGLAITISANGKVLSSKTIISFVLMTVGIVVLLIFSDKWESGGVERAFWLMFR